MEMRCYRLAMMPLNCIIRKCIGGYKFIESQEKINHLIYINDMKLFAKSENLQEILIQAIRRFS